MPSKSSDAVDEDGDWEEPSLRKSVLAFVDKHFIMLICTGIILVSTSLFIWQSIVPNEVYSAWGTLQSFDSDGVDVNITGLGSGAFAHARIGEAVHANAGMCNSGEFASRCQLGSSVSLKFVKNRIGQEFWYVTALVIGIPRAVSHGEG